MNKQTRLQKLLCNFGSKYNCLYTLWKHDVEWIANIYNDLSTMDRKEVIKPDFFSTIIIFYSFHIMLL
jgi:hypothetical protein